MSRVEPANRKRLVLGFDGVCSNYASGWCGARNIPDPPVDGAMAFLVEAVQHFEVYIFSSRSHQWGGRRAMRNWIRKQLVDWQWAESVADRPLPGEFWTPVDIEESICLWADRVVRQLHFPLFKPAAHLTIDDRAITFEGRWPPMADIEAFVPWNRRRE
jgi:hypothetical protein